MIEFSGVVLYFKSLSKTRIGCKISLYLKSIEKTKFEVEAPNTYSIFESEVNYYDLRILNHMWKELKLQYDEVEGVDVDFLTDVLREDFLQQILNSRHKLVCYEVAYPLSPIFKIVKTLDK